MSIIGRLSSGGAVIAAAIWARKLVKFGVRSQAELEDLNLQVSNTAVNVSLATSRSEGAHVLSQPVELVPLLAATGANHNAHTHTITAN